MLWAMKLCYCKHQWLLIRQIYECILLVTYMILIASAAISASILLIVVQQNLRVCVWEEGSWRGGRCLVFRHERIESGHEN